jgi:hypothetical protein
MLYFIKFKIQEIFTLNPTTHKVIITVLLNFNYVFLINHFNQYITNFSLLIFYHQYVEECKDFDEYLC